MAPPKSSNDGETKDGSSSETEPMEASTPSLLGKRKAESAEAEDPEEGEGEGEGDEEDKDSFDGLEYNSSDYNVHSDEEFNEKCRNYNRAVIETKGFLEPSDNHPRYRWTGIVYNHTT